MSDPSHYTNLDPQPIDVRRAWNLNFNLGNVLKYIARCDYKGEKERDLRKAIRYLEFELEEMKEEKPLSARTGILWSCGLCEGGGIVQGTGSQIKACPRCKGEGIEP